MAYTQYFGSKPVSDWTANGPAESGHNFIDQINEQSGKIASQENKYNEQYQNIGTARNAYENQFKNMQNYSDVYQQAKGTEGVDDAKAQYQKSLNSVNATAAAMNNLPSSINANSNVVLNSNQRNAALGNQMAKYQNTMDYWTRQNQGDLSSYQTALSAAQNTANQETALQRQDTNIALDRLNTEMNMANELYNQVLNERNIMRTIYGQMYDDEYRHMQNEYDIWAQNLNAENQRYAQDQETARNNARIAADKYIAEAGNRYQEYMLKQQEEANKAASRASDLDRINKIYAQYKGELDDLDAQTRDFGSYLFGNNSLFGTGFGFGQTTGQKAQNLRNKGFEDYLYNADPYAQKLLRENYSDLLGTYGIRG